MSKTKPNICKYSHIFVFLSGKVIKMLVKLLSQKSFLLQIFLGLLFLALFFLSIYPLSIDFYSILAVLILLISVVLGALFYIYSNLVKQPSFGIWFYLIWLIVFSGIVSDFKMCVALLLNTLIFIRWITTTNQNENKRILFESGFLLAVSTFFYPPSIFLIVFLIVAYLYTQTISLRGILMLIFGLLLPTLIGIQLLYLADRIEYFKEIENSFYPQYFDSIEWALIPIGLILIICWLDHLTNFATQNINKRLKYFLAFIYFVNWLIILVLYGSDKTYSLMFLGLPISVFLSRFVYYRKSNSKKEVWLGLFAVAMAIYYFRNELIEIYIELLGNISFQF